MVGIVNVGTPDNYLVEDECLYEVRINRDVITTFRHFRSDGLGTCLRKAADAAEDAVARKMAAILGETKR